ncbi:methyltransferase [Micromonospora sp. CNB394]|uniref:methyltransferase n=1 Tax=Micromonospora sp. CNB394 TaxID=1169151 RepID=UPI00035E7782|nr:methyltransferase [Micromonospora sp. CNB394]
MTSDIAYLRSVALGYRLSQALYVFAELGVADLLAAGPATPDALAGRCGVHPPSLRRLLRVAGAMGLIIEGPGGLQELTDRGRLLRKDVEGSQWGRVRAVGEPWHWGPWGRLLETVSTGKSAFETEHGANSFDYFDRTPGAGDTMMSRVTDEARVRGAAIADAFDFSGSRHLVDVGGGRGAILGVVLSRHPHLRGTLIDLPYAVEGAASVLDELGVADRCDVVAGDFRSGVPTDGDVYLLSAVVHSWSDDDSARLIRRCLAHGERVLVVDEVLADAGLPALLKDLQLMVFSGGRLRTMEEYESLFARAGARLLRHQVIRPGELLFEGEARR